MAVRWRCDSRESKLDYFKKWEDGGKKKLWLKMCTREPE